MPTTHPNSPARRSCSLSFHTVLSLPSSEHNLFNRAMTESSLVFTAGDFYSNISPSRDDLIESHDLVKFQ